MRTLIQRVNSASVSSKGELVSSIGKGLLLFIAFQKSDTQEIVRKSMEKTVLMRIFSDSNDKLNLSLKDTGGEVLAISQFTLASDCTHGHRPGFDNGLRYNEARPLYEYALKCLNDLMPSSVKSGLFGEDMQVALVNDGPCTFMLDIRA